LLSFLKNIRFFKIIIDTLDYIIKFCKDKIYQYQEVN